MCGMVSTICGAVMKNTLPPVTMSPDAQRTANPEMPATLLDKQETRIRRMFGEIAPRHDPLTPLLILHSPPGWAWRTTPPPPPQGTAPILDLCAGTGDLA